MTRILSKVLSVPSRDRAITDLVTLIENINHSTTQSDAVVAFEKFYETLYKLSIPLDQILQSDRLFVLDEVRRVTDEPLRVQDKLVRFAYKMLLQHIVIKPYQPKGFELTLKDERYWFRHEIQNLCDSRGWLIPMIKHFVRDIEYSIPRWSCRWQKSDLSPHVRG